jgi:hypothetical protein
MIAFGSPPFSGGVLTQETSFQGTAIAGLRLNNLTTLQKNALSTPQAGQMVYDTTLGRVQGREGSTWYSYVRTAGDTLSGALLFADGTEALPGAAFATDPSMGMRRSAANVLSLVVAGTSRLEISSTSQFRVRSTATVGFTGSTASASLDAFFRRRGAASIGLGDTAAASPVAQTLSGQDSRSGTDTNVGGGNFTLHSGIGTGTGTLSGLILQSPIAVASGTGAQTLATGLTIKGGVAILTAYTVATLPAAASFAGGTAYVTDANATTFLSTVAGGGANIVPVFSNGTNWLIG